MMHPILSFGAGEARRSTPIEGREADLYIYAKRK
jgi:hypothetical protein